MSLIKNKMRRRIMCMQSRARGKNVTSIVVVCQRTSYVCDGKGNDQTVQCMRPVKVPITLMSVSMVL